MHLNVRQLRNSASNYGRLLTPLTLRERERYDLILREGTRLIADTPRQNFTFNHLAESVRAAPATVRRLFADLDDLVGVALQQHLMRVAEAFGAIPPGPNRASLCRARYFDLTHTPSGAPNALQVVMTHERRALPADLRDPIEAMRHSLGTTMAGELAEELLAMFEQPSNSLSDVEAMLPALAAARAAEFQALRLPPPPPAPPELEPELGLEPEPEADPEPESEIAGATEEWAPPHTEPACETGTTNVDEADPEPAPSDPHDPYSHLDWFEHAPSANDRFFAERGIPTRSRGPPK